MSSKIFASYKYADDSVYELEGEPETTVRTYVDKFEELLGENIFKGEKDGEDLSELSDETIWEKLKNRIYDSTLTVVFISPNMKEDIPDREQWIPWEISYSLKETSRRDKNGKPVTSKTNAMLAVVLPDKSNSYDYYLEDKKCCESGCTMHNRNKLFKILKDNKFNYKKGNKRCCNQGDTVWNGEASYIKAVKWGTFANSVNNVNKYIREAYERQENIKDYEINKELF